MDLLVTENVLYRYKKKWVKRNCKLARTTRYSDAVVLLVAPDNLKQKSSFNKKQEKVNVMAKFVIYGHKHGLHILGQMYVMLMVSKSTVEALAFEDFETMKHWSDELTKWSPGICQFADLIYADKRSQLKPKLEGCLFINCSHISYINSPGNYEPKLLMSWKIADICDYGYTEGDKSTSRRLQNSKNNVNVVQNGNNKNGTDILDSNLQEKTFVLNASSICQGGPNVHQFSCSDPKLLVRQLDKYNNDSSIPKSPKNNMCDFPNFRRSRHQSLSNYSSSSQSNLAWQQWDNTDGGVSMLTEGNKSANYKCSSVNFFDSGMSIPSSKDTSVGCFDKLPEEEVDGVVLPKFDKQSEPVEMSESNVIQLCRNKEKVPPLQICDSKIEEQLSQCSTSKKTTLLERFPFESESLAASMSSSYAVNSSNNRQTIIDDGFNSNNWSPSSSCTSASFMSRSNTRKRSTESDYCSISSFRIPNISGDTSISESGRRQLTNPSFERSISSGSNGSSNCNSSASSVERSLSVNIEKRCDTNKIIGLEDQTRLLNNSISFDRMTVSQGMGNVGCNYAILEFSKLEDQMSQVSINSSSTVSRHTISD